eukprot:12427265-Karenia_brevis.AAC.1
MGANAVASEKQGRCPITAITAAKGIRWDPWIMGPVNTIMHMIQIINAWDGEVGREWIKSLWDPRHAPHPWARVKGPMGATHMHLMEMGWEMQWWQ